MSISEKQRYKALTFFFPKGCPPILSQDASISEKTLEEINCALDYLRSFADIIWEHPRKKFRSVARELRIPETRLRDWWASYYLEGYAGLRDFIAQQDQKDFWVTHL